MEGHDDHNSESSSQAFRAQSICLPSSMLENEFGKVYIREEGGQRHVEFTVWVRCLPPSLAEGWQTGVALDASQSMKKWYGRDLLPVKISQEVVADYKQKGWLVIEERDGRQVRLLKRDAYADANERGIIRFTENIVEPLAREFSADLAAGLAANGRASLIYWACGEEGGQYEEIGDFDEQGCAGLELCGPEHFGDGTRLTPAVRYFVDRFSDAPRGMYVFITDGRIQDMEELKDYTTELARQIEAGRRNLVKCVLIGVGAEIDEEQLNELDDLDTGTDVDLWDHKIAKEMRALSEIMVELVAENCMIGTSVSIFDAAGNEVARFTDGLPNRIRFSMPASSDSFELRVGDHRVRQSVVLPE